MNAESYNDKYANLTSECARDICDMLIENNVKKIKFNRTDKEGIEPAAAVFYDMSDVPQDIVTIELCDDDGTSFVEVRSSTCVGYIEYWGHIEGFRDTYIFDMYRAVCEAIEAGQFVKNEE